MDATTAALKRVSVTDLRGMIPFPPDEAPNLAFSWETMTADEIMALPPQLITHVNRTAARDGFQVVSPRQVPVNGIINRVKPDRDYPLMFISGSDAEKSETWPTLPGSPPINQDWLCGAPRVKSGVPLATRSSTRAQTLQVRSLEQEDSLSGPMLRSKAMVDFQSRPDIGGDPEGLAESFEEVWAAAKDSYSEHIGETASIDVDLNRYAMGMDVRLPRSLAPIQDRRVTAVRATAGTRSVFGSERSCDWTRARVAAEVAVQITADNEHVSLIDLSDSPLMLVGHKAPNHPSVLAFQVASTSSWSCDPVTFTVLTDHSVPPVRSKLPARLTDRLLSEHGVLAPSLIARHRGVPVQWTRRVAATAATDAPTQLMGAMSALRMATAVTRTLSKTPQAKLRDELVTAMESAGVANCVYMARLIKGVRDESSCLRRSAPHAAVDKITSRLLYLDCHMGKAMSESAGARGEDVEEWFKRCSSEAPFDMAMGSGSWARLAAYYVLQAKDDRWKAAGDRLVAFAYESMTTPARLVKCAPPTKASAMNLQQAIDDYACAYKRDWSSWCRGTATAAKLLAHERFAEESIPAALAYETAFRAWMFLARYVSSFRAYVNLDDLEALREAVGADRDDATAAFWEIGEDLATSVTVSHSSGVAYRAFVTSLIPHAWAKTYLSAASREAVDSPWIEFRKMKPMEGAKYLRKKARGNYDRWLLEPVLSPARFGSRMTKFKEEFHDDVRTVVDSLRERWHAARAAAKARPPVPVASAATVQAKEPAFPMFAPELMAAATGTTGYDWLNRSDIDPHEMADILDTADELREAGVDLSLDDNFESLQAVLDAFDVDNADDLIAEAMEGARGVGQLE